MLGKSSEIWNLWKIYPVADKNMSVQVAQERLMEKHLEKSPILIAAVVARHVNICASCVWRILAGCSLVSSYSL